MFHKYYAGGGGYIKTETFDSLSILVNNQPDQKYAVQAVSPINYNGRNYYWFSGDFNPTSSTDLLITDATTINANYKGIQISSNINAFSNSSQRKIVRTPDGVMHLVYGSLGRVWYEISTDNGSTWQLMNGGQPLDNGAGKLPAIDYYGNLIAIVFQQQNGSGYDIMLKTFYDSGIQYIFGISLVVRAEQNEPYSIDSNPVIGWGANYKVMVV